MPRASLEIESRIETSARAALSNFGAAAALQDSVFECNPIQLDGEIYEDVPFQFDDRGGNRCGCGDHTEQCKVVSMSIEPPRPLE